MAWHLTTRMLRMMIAVADTPSAAAAAAVLNITPSALSHQIRETEAALRITLFERVGRRVVLSALGEQLVASARVIVAELERAEGTLERSRRSNKPSLRVGGGPYPVHRWFASPLRLNHDRMPHLDFISNGKFYPLARAISHGDLDLALAAGEHHERGVTVLPLFRDELVAVVSSSHPLAARPHLEAGDLRDETYITYSRVTEYGLEDDLLFRPSRIAPAHLVEASTVDVILDLVASGLGFTIVSRWAVASAPQRAKLAALPLTGSGLQVSWSALVRDADARDPQVEALLKLLELPEADAPVACGPMPPPATLW